MRPALGSTMLEIALVLSRRATCPKLSVGCVLVDRYGRILATGYNGPPRGVEHCTDATPCPGRWAPKGADLCRAVHAESNALIQCKNPDAIVTCYSTHVPCMRCMKELMNTGCTTIHYLEDTFAEPAALALWKSVYGHEIMKWTL